MRRGRGSIKFFFWLLLRSKRYCEDDRCQELAARWNATMARFGL